MDGDPDDPRSNVVGMATYKNDARGLTLGVMLRMLEHEINEGTLDPDSQALLILSKETKEGFHFDFRNAGLRISEMISLVEIAKAKLIGNMEID